MANLNNDELFQTTVDKLVQTTVYLSQQILPRQMCIIYDVCNNTYEYDLASSVFFQVRLADSKLTTYEF